MVLNTDVLCSKLKLKKQNHFKLMLKNSLSNHLKLIIGGRSVNTLKLCIMSLIKTR